MDEFESWAPGEEYDPADVAWWRGLATDTSSERDPSVADVLAEREHAAGAVRRAGVPSYRRVDELRRLGGVEGAVNDLVWGRDDAEFDAIIEYEFALEQARRPHAFVRKFRPGRGKRRGRIP